MTWRMVRTKLLGAPVPELLSLEGLSRGHALCQADSPPLMEELCLIRLVDKSRLSHVVYVTKH